jgi:hypothetical protein
VILPTFSKLGYLPIETKLIKVERYGNSPSALCLLIYLNVRYGCAEMLTLSRRYRFTSWKRTSDLRIHEYTP